jgi:hypothetical protein
MPPHQFKKKKIMVYVSGHAIPKGLKLSQIRELF